MSHHFPIVSTIHHHFPRFFRSKNAMPKRGVATHRRASNLRPSGCLAAVAGPELGRGPGGGWVGWKFASGW